MFQFEIKMVCLKNNHEHVFTDETQMFSLCFRCSLPKPFFFCGNSTTLRVLSLFQWHTLIIYLDGESTSAEKLRFISSFVEHFCVTGSQRTKETTTLRGPLHKCIYML